HDRARQIPRPYHRPRPRLGLHRPRHRGTLAPGSSRLTAARYAMTSGRECVFCQIVAGTSPSKEIYRDDATLAFIDIHSANDGLCLVIPKRQFENVFGMPPEAFGEVGSTVAKVARAVNEVLQPGGISLVQANRELAGQTVFHVHVHVLPRRAGD